MAVPDPGEAEISGGSIGSNGSNGSARAADLQETETVVPGAWLAHIEETDDAIITHLLDQFRVNMEARDYFLLRAAKAPPPDIFDDDRRRCDQCANLTERGLCLAARRGEIVASRGYEPIRDLPRRCEGYAPGADDADRRPGRERWPGLT